MLTLTNLDHRVMPAEPTRANAIGHWPAGEPAAGASLIDNAHEGWARSLTIDQAWGQPTLEADHANILHLHRPPGEPFFCAEPVNHLPDAINRGGMARLLPGETQRLAISFGL